MGWIYYSYGHVVPVQVIGFGNVIAGIPVQGDIQPHSHWESTAVARPGVPLLPADGYQFLAVGAPLTFWEMAIDRATIGIPVNFTQSRVFALAALVVKLLIGGNSLELWVICIDLDQ